jgi:hypothetical protein
MLNLGVSADEALLGDLTELGICVVKQLFNFVLISLLVEETRLLSRETGGVNQVFCPLKILWS